MYTIHMDTREILRLAVEWDREECFLWPRKFSGKRPLVSSVYINKYIKDYRSPINVHRCVYMIGYEVALESIELVLHTCGRGEDGCISLNHLYLGTDQDNADDRKTGVTKIGKLQPDEVTIIRRRNDGTSMYRRQVAKIFGVSISCIDQLLDGQTWK